MRGLADMRGTSPVAAYAPVAETKPANRAATAISVRSLNLPSSDMCTVLHSLGRRHRLTPTPVWGWRETAASFPIGHKY